MKVWWRRVPEIIWNCRFHPSNGWHEVGCPHVEWTKEQLQETLESKKRFEQEQVEKLQRGELVYKLVNA